MSVAEEDEKTAASKISPASQIVGAQWQLAPNPVVITLAGVISELTAVKCQSGREESARVINAEECWRNRRCLSEKNGWTSTPFQER